MWLNWDSNLQLLHLDFLESNTLQTVLCSMATFYLEICKVITKLTGGLISLSEVDFGMKAAIYQVPGRGSDRGYIDGAPLF